MLTPGWPDSSEGLYALKKTAIICTLSNGNARLLVDMVGHRPFAVVLGMKTWCHIGQICQPPLGRRVFRRAAGLVQAVSAPLFLLAFTLQASYLPARNPKVYKGAIQHLELPPEKCAMVAAHIDDLRAAASHGMKTVYVRRPTEDGGSREQVKGKAEGGEVDVVVNSFCEVVQFQ